MKREAVVILVGLFILGVAGGLERGLISVAGALIAWIAAGAVIGAVLMGRRRSNG